MDDRHLPKYSIGEAAKMLGVLVPFIRQLEKCDLLLTNRTEYGKRLYSQCDIDYIRALVNLGKTHNLEQINSMIAGFKCWEIIECSPAMRQECPNYLNIRTPCWARKDLSQEEKEKRCLACPMYRTAMENIAI
jgi:DNA-binding transcriptional MerR regulator